MIIIWLFYTPTVKSDSLSSKSTALGHHPPRLTRNQQAVLDLLHQHPHTLSAQELYVLLRHRRAMGLATVYRALGILKLRGLIKSRIGVNGESLYSPVAPDQHYLTCLQCGQSFPLDHCPVQELETRLQESVPFRIYYHTLEFFGRCEPCTHGIR